ncbi:MAG: ABC transporter ATP-binding protein [Lachnospiraceae bacterium]|nr:ABC transporter ATP-binding protein [Lachnospiraceae bacterium]
MNELLKIENLKKYYKSPKGMVHAVDDVTFDIEKGSTLGVVGESGCGKSTLGRVLVHLEDVTDGNFYFEGQNVSDISGRRLREYRNNAQIIFQDPYSSLDPRMTVEEAIAEPLYRVKGNTRNQIQERVTEMMNICGIAQRIRFSYPHELDGGRRQRVVIARALALRPKFIVCDEPVSALDVSIQAQILNLLKDLQSEHGYTYMFITHDLSVVKHISQKICVMYLGQVVESCDAEELFKNPSHPYTQALLSAVPSTDPRKSKERIILRGEITSPIDPEPGCRFYARCRYATEDCKKPQKLRQIAPGHEIACAKAGNLQ